jgi:hypothetical protein
LATPDAASRSLYVELEFHTLARNLPVGEDVAAPEEEVPAAAPPPATYITIDSVEELGPVIERARSAPFVSVDAEGVVDPRAPQTNDPLRTELVGLSIAIGPGEAFYFPLAHRAPVRAEEGQVGLGFDDLLGDPGDGAPGGARARKVEPTVRWRARWRRAPPPLSSPRSTVPTLPRCAHFPNPAVGKTAPRHAILLLRRSESRCEGSTSTQRSRVTCSTVAGRTRSISWRSVS